MQYWLQLKEPNNSNLSRTLPTVLLYACAHHVLGGGACIATSLTLVRLHVYVYNRRRRLAAPLAATLSTYEWRVVVYELR
jgi:hypothetical protein